MGKRRGKQRTVPPRERVIGIWQLSTLELCRGVCVYVYVCTFLVAAGGQPFKLTAFQSLVNGISELSHQSNLFT